MSGSRKKALTLIELLIALAIVAALLALALPAIQKARESARRAHCQNNLRQIGVAVGAHESTFGRLPAGRDAQHAWNHSWATTLLPHVEESQLFKRYDWQQAWDAPANQPVSQSDVSVFRCPSAIENWAGKTDYGGNYGSALTGLTPGFQHGFAWESGTMPPINIRMPGNYRRRGVRMGEVTDGSSHTFLILEDADRPVAEGGMWANGHNCFAHDNGPINAEISNEIFSRHPGGAHALLADGSTRFFSEETDLSVTGGFCTRNRGEVTAP